MAKLLNRGLRGSAAVTAALVMAALTLSGCGVVGGVANAHPDAAPITLRMGTDDTPGRPAADQILHFAEQVNELSGGQLRIQPVWQAAGDTGSDDWDQKVARMLTDGDLELAMIPSRAWDKEGVRSMRALNAPMLVTSDALVAEIVTGDLADEMLAGLDDVGVHGLALLPEGIQRVLSFGDPLTSVDDFTDQLIRVPASKTTYATFKALGAVPDDATATVEAAADGRVAGAESSFFRSGPLAGARTAAVGNLPLWPKVNSLVIAADAYTGITEDQQRILRKAARNTRQWSIDTLPGDATAARSYCADGNRIVNADADDVAAFRDATAPVTKALKKDDTTRELIRAIQDLAERTDAHPAHLEPCDGSGRTQ